MYRKVIKCSSRQRESLMYPQTRRNVREMTRWKKIYVHTRLDASLHSYTRNPESDLKLLSNFVRATSVVKSTPRRPSRISCGCILPRAARARMGYLKKCYLSSSASIVIRGCACCIARLSTTVALGWNKHYFFSLTAKVYKHTLNPSMQGGNLAFQVINTISRV
jgi:hypothetical protein